MTKNSFGSANALENSMINYLHKLKITVTVLRGSHHRRPYYNFNKLFSTIIVFNYLTRSHITYLYKQVGFSCFWNRPFYVFRQYGNPYSDVKINVEKQYKHFPKLYSD